MLIVLWIKMNINVCVAHKTEDSILSAVLITEECNIDKDFLAAVGLQMTCNANKHSSSHPAVTGVCPKYFFHRRGWNMLRIPQCWTGGVWGQGSVLTGVTHSSFQCPSHLNSANIISIPQAQRCVPFFPVWHCDVLWFITCWPIARYIEQACAKNGLHDQ